MPGVARTEPKSWAAITAVAAASWRLANNSNSTKGDAARRSMAATKAISAAKGQSPQPEAAGGIPAPTRALGQGQHEPQRGRRQ